ncbi:MAG: hypothetical protein SVZ03_06765 [Spirochaetota bacterium]|nr:hypothetical protein [Spirochaetota bacterium]
MVGKHALVGWKEQYELERQSDYAEIEVMCSIDSISHKKARLAGLSSSRRSTK